jgi:dTMP kinase
MSNGYLIVIDGTDGSGKGTQTKILVDRLRQNNYQVEMADFPRYGQKSAGLVEEYLNGKYGTADEVGPYRASILYACDRYAASFEMRQWLEAGKIVICNRYVSSNMGHQAGKIHDIDERDKFLHWLDNLEHSIFQIPRPHLNILLFMPPAIGQALVDQKGQRDYIGDKKRDIHEADINHLKNAADAYHYVAQKHQWEIINCAPEQQLRSIDDIATELWMKVSEKISGGRS